MMQDGGKKKQTQKAGTKAPPRKPTAAPKPSTRATISKKGVAHESSHRKPTAPLVAFGSLTPYERPAAPKPPLIAFGSVQSIKDDGLVRAMSMGGKKQKTRGGDPPVTEYRQSLSASSSNSSGSQSRKTTRMGLPRQSIPTTQGNPKLQEILSGVLGEIDADKRENIAKIRQTREKMHNDIEAALAAKGGKKKTKK